MHRQDELTRLIQTKRAKAARKGVASAPITPELAGQRLRARIARTARKERKMVEMKKKEGAA